MDESPDNYNASFTDTDDELEIDATVQSVMVDVNQNAGVGKNNDWSVRSHSTQSTHSLAELDRRHHHNYFYNVKQKLKIAKEAVNNNTIQGTAWIYRVDENCVRYWLSTMEKLMAKVVINTNAKTTNIGPSVEYLELETILFQWIEDLRQEDITMQTHEIILQACPWLELSTATANCHKQTAKGVAVPTNCHRLPRSRVLITCTRATWYGSTGSRQYVAL
jgi:hypothetical protein